MRAEKGPFWYLPISSVILASYIISGYAIFCIKYNISLPWTIPPEAKHCLLLFFLGILGATTFAGVFFAKDANRYFKEKTDEPNFLDPIGYLLLIVSGGVTGLVLVVAVRAGFSAAYSDTINGEMKPMASFVLAFIGGIATDRVKSFLISLGNKIMRPEALPSKKPSDESKK